MAHTTGRMSDAPKDFLDWCASLSFRHAVVRSADEGADVLRAWGILHDETE